MLNIFNISCYDKLLMKVIINLKVI